MNGVRKAMDKYKRILEVNNVSLDSHLRVYLNLSNLYQALHRGFSSAALHQKGKSELFKEFIESEHPGSFLFSVPNVNGARQDVSIDAAHSLFTNQPYHVHFLTEVLSYKESDNKLKLSLCISFTSEEMVRVIREMSMLWASITNSLRCLADKSIELALHSWTVRQKSKAINVVEKVLLEIIEDHRKFTNQEHMMNMFSEQLNVLPPFKEHIKHIHEEKEQKCVKNGNKVPKIK